MIYKLDINVKSVYTCFIIFRCVLIVYRYIIILYKCFEVVGLNVYNSISDVIDMRYKFVYACMSIVSKKGNVYVCISNMCTASRTCLFNVFYTILD